MSTKKSNLVDLGRITTVFGVKGWVKVQSYTEPRENLLQYKTWWLKTRHGVKSIEVDQGRTHGSHGQVLVVHIKGVDDCDLAREYCQVSVAVELDQLPELDDSEYYWHQLEGLQVVSDYDGQRYEFGRVKGLLETGANDVLVVSACEGSIDDRERLVPYVPEQFVKSIDLQAGLIVVDWDPAF